MHHHGRHWERYEAGDSSYVRESLRCGQRVEDEVTF
jgi:hypothetical protein